MPASEFIAMASSSTVLGDPLLKTQHFIGASRYEKVSEDEVVGHHQLRVPHQRYANDGEMKTIKVKGHAHSTNTHWYKKVDGIWKFAGLCPNIRWYEYDFDRVFEQGRNQLGEPEKEEAKPALPMANQDALNGPAQDELAFEGSAMHEASKLEVQTRPAEMYGEDKTKDDDQMSGDTEIGERAESNDKEEGMKELLGKVMGVPTSAPSEVAATA